MIAAHRLPSPHWPHFTLSMSHVASFDSSLPFTNFPPLLALRRRSEKGRKPSGGRFSALARPLMFHILSSWTGSLHSWRMNVDILRPRRFLCCASKDRKWISWLLIGWEEGEMVWYERNRHRTGDMWSNAESLFSHCWSYHTVSFVAAVNLCELLRFRVKLKMCKIKPEFLVLFLLYQLNV